MSENSIHKSADRYRIHAEYYIEAFEVLAQDTQFKTRTAGYVFGPICTVLGMAAELTFKWIHKANSSSETLPIRGHDLKKLYEEVSQYLNQSAFEQEIRTKAAQGFVLPDGVKKAFLKSGRSSEDDYDWSNQLSTLNSFYFEDLDTSAKYWSSYPDSTFPKNHYEGGDRPSWFGRTSEAAQQVCNS